MRSLFFLVGVSAAMSSFAQSFSAGNTFTTLPVYGDLMVQCSDPLQGTRTMNFRCTDERLSPVEYDYFTATNVDADSVDLIATFENGKQSKLKTVGFKDGKSTSRVNLWIGSLLQRPLLDVGANKVSYTFKKAGQIVKQGDFTVQVNAGNTSRCPMGFINSTLASDCDNGSSACDQYFQRYNYCQ